MKGRVRRTSRAIGDIYEVASYLANDSVRAAERFLQAVENSFQALARMPPMGSPYRPASRGGIELRRWPVEGFRDYLIFYRVMDDGIDGVRVLHGARDIERLLE
jgi:toxin ParE1/3/4